MAWDEALTEFAAAAALNYSGAGCVSRGREKGGETPDEKDT